MSFSSRLRTLEKKTIKPGPVYGIIEVDMSLPDPISHETLIEHNAEYKALFTKAQLQKKDLALVIFSSGASASNAEYIEGGCFAEICYLKYTN